MSIPRPASRAKLVVGAFMADASLFVPAIKALARHFGRPDMLSPWYSFHHTAYYEPEMGGPLFRRLAGFASLVDQRDLPHAKWVCRAVEQDFAGNGKRRVNLDPGLITAERFVLATFKNFTHRVYLDRGVYADLTLLFHNRAWQALDWTYPDYREPELQDFLTSVRKHYLARLSDLPDNT